MLKDKKILLILTDLGMGGITTAAVNFCNGLLARGCNVDILLMSDKEPERKSLVPDGVNVLHLKGAAKLWNLGPSMIRRQRNPMKKAMLWGLGVIKKLINRKSRWMRLLFRKKIMLEGYDAAVAYRQCAPCYHLALYCVEAKSKVAFVHGDVDFMQDISTWYKYMPTFDSVAYVSNAVKDGFIRKFPELEKNATTVYNVFNVESIIERSKLPCDITFDKNKINIITVSRIDEKLKGIDRIPPICKMLKEKYGDIFHWYVAGSGPYLSRAIETANDQSVSDVLSFLGGMENPYNLMSQADISVLPTHTEAYPMVVGESLILGIPIISSRYPAVEEIVVNGKTGLVADQSIESIFEKICMLIDDKGMYEQMKENCMAFQYDNDRSYEQFLKAITK